jgi:hypothetical protein
MKKMALLSLAGLALAFSPLAQAGDSDWLHGAAFEEAAKNFAYERAHPELFPQEVAPATARSWCLIACEKPWDQVVLECNRDYPTEQSASACVALAYRARHGS